MMQTISIRNVSPRCAVIDIEGVIGVAEELQFEQPEARVATYEKFREAIERIGQIKSRRVIVNIRSAGGEVNDALLIHDTLAALEATITTRCYGYIASAATIIAQAASRGRREISANALYLVHNATCKADGNAASLARTIELLGQTDTRIAAIYAARSGRPEGEFVDLMSENEGNGRWLSPQEALEAGLVDRIIPAAAAVSNEASEQIQRLLEKIQNSLSERSDRSAGQITELQNQLASLEARNAKLAALPTSTLPQEDPAMGESILSANQSAYAEDAKNFN